MRFKKVIKKTNSQSKLKDRLDKVFSVYIRTRSIDKRGYTNCFTCGKPAHWKDLHCGHYISRRHLSTRWEEKNCKPQCVGCNIFNQGAADVFAIKLVNLYGPQILELLNLKKNSIAKYGAFELGLMIEQFESLTALQ